MLFAFLQGSVPKAGCSGTDATLGGSHRLESTGGRAQEGDLSAILIENTPKSASWRRTPRPETALIPDFEEKVQAICREAAPQRVTSFAGVPSWNLVLMNRVLEYTGKQNILRSVARNGSSSCTAA